MTDRIKVLFDTDPGVDDAMALVLLARHPGFDLVGVTTVFGNGGIDVVTRNALVLKDRFGFDAPVARGAATTLTGSATLHAAMVHGENGLGDVPLPAPRGAIDPRPAAQFIVDTVRAQPGEITLVAVGRMTNLALALALDPGIAGLVKAVVVMGGAFGRNGHGGNVTPVAEANIFGDAPAADIVFGAGWPLTIVGLDVTQEVIMSRAYLEALRKDAGADGQFIWDITRHYESFHARAGHVAQGIFTHDPSAVGYVLHPQMFRVLRGQVRVATEGVARGQTILRPTGSFARATDFDGRPEVAVCVGVDSAAFLDFYRDTLVRKQG